MMRRAALIALGCTVAEAAWAPASTPTRAPGLWTFHLVYDDLVLPDSQMCIDQTAERRLTIAGVEIDRTHCEVYALTPTGKSTWAVRSVCTLESKARAQTIGTVKGDLASAYSVDSTAVTSAFANPLLDGTHHMAIAAKRVGPCPAGQRGGDITTDGKTENVFR